MQIFSMTLSIFPKKHKCRIFCLRCRGKKISCHPALFRFLFLPKNIHSKSHLSAVLIRHQFRLISVFIVYTRANHNLFLSNFYRPLVLPCFFLLLFCSTAHEYSRIFTKFYVNWDKFPLFGFRLRTQIIALRKDNMVYIKIISLAMRKFLFGRPSELC